MFFFRSLLVAGLGYLCGAIPSGSLIARLYGVDLTQQGSGKTGATNVLRTLGPRAAVFALGADLLKGTMAVRLARRISPGRADMELLSAVGAVIGHAYSVFIGFKGGRSIVVAAGASLTVAPGAIVSTALISLPIIAITRYVSLGSVVGALVGGALVSAQGIRTRNGALTLWGVLLSSFLVLAHRDNIQRLLAGTERKLGEKSEPRPQQ